MSIDPLSSAVVEELERDRSDAFQPLPFHYIEIAHMLCTHAKDTFGGDFYRVHPAVQYVITLVRLACASMAGHSLKDMQTCHVMHSMQVSHIVI